MKASLLGVGLDIAILREVIDIKSTTVDIAPVLLAEVLAGHGVQFAGIEQGFTIASRPAGAENGTLTLALGLSGTLTARAGTKGDLVVHLKVVTPRNLTKRQEELLRELEEIDAKHVSPERKGWLDRVRDFFSADGAKQS